MRSLSIRFREQWADRAAPWQKHTNGHRVFEIFTFLKTLNTLLCKMSTRDIWKLRSVWNMLRSIKVTLRDAKKCFSLWEVHNFQNKTTSSELWFAFSWLNSTYFTRFITTSIIVVLNSYDLGLILVYEELLSYTFL